MNKTIVILAMFGVLMFSNTANAQTPNILPSAGIKPDSFLFLLDRFGESMQEFFTFNAEAKARLQIEFAGERIAEINAMVKENGPKAKGVDKAKTLLLGNVAYAAEILKEEKAGGKNVTKLAKEIDGQFDAQERLLVQSFQDARKKLKGDRLALKKSLAEQSGNDSLMASLEQQINDLDSQDKDLKETKNEIKKSLRSEKNKIEEELDSKDRNEDNEKRFDEDQREKSDEGEIENENENENEMEEAEEVEDREDSESEDIEKSRGGERRENDKSERNREGNRNNNERNQEN